MVYSELLLFCLVTLIGSSLQVILQKPNYDPKTDGMVELDAKNFKNMVLNSNAVWLVVFEFPGDQCAPCMTMSSIIKKAVPLIKQKRINVGFVNSMSPEGSKLVSSYGITDYPTVYIFGSEKESPIQYKYFPSSSEALLSDIEFLMKKPTAAEGQCGKDTAQLPETGIYELTDTNFDQVVLKCDDPWVINFYVPNVELCTQFIPYFEAAAKEFKGRAKFGSFYQYSSAVADKYTMQRVCTVKLFPAGNKNRQPLDYNNGTHSTTISTNLIPWLKATLAPGFPSPGIYEVTSKSVIESKCTKSGASACIFLFLAKQCDADCRSKALNLLKQVSNELKAEDWSWLWTTQGSQQDIELAFGIQTFPGAVGVDLKTNTYSVLRGMATDSKFKEFAHQFSREIVPSKSLPSGFPAVRFN